MWHSWKKNLSHNWSQLLYSDIPISRYCTSRTVPVLMMYHTILALHTIFLHKYEYYQIDNDIENAIKNWSYFSYIFTFQLIHTLHSLYPVLIPCPPLLHSIPTPALHAEWFTRPSLFSPLPRIELTGMEVSTYRIPATALRIAYCSSVTVLPYHTRHARKSSPFSVPRTPMAPVKRFQASK